MCQGLMSIPFIYSYINVNMFESKTVVKSHAIIFSFQCRFIILRHESIDSKQVKSVESNITQCKCL